jgi:hypothetical protein
VLRRHRLRHQRGQRGRRRCRRLQGLLSAEWPGNFFGGKGKARLYLDSGASADQRRALEAVFSGKKGGMFEGLLGAVVSSWLPAKTLPIAIRRGDTLALSVGDVGKATIALFRDQAGKAARVQGTAAQGAFQSASMEIAGCKETRWGRSRHALVARRLRHGAPGELERLSAR